MAKRCVVFRNENRKQTVKRDAAKREALKATIINQELSFDERMAARDKLNKLDRNGAKVRVRNRCAFTGRPRGYTRLFGLCRNVFRELASKGILPGVRKGSL